MDNKNRTLVFASDKPVTEDRLGTHKHLASLLVQIVQSKSDNPLVVGIFGGWGTGKSSIVKMYEEIAKNQDIKNVYIDAWMFSNAQERFGAGLLRSLAKEVLPWLSRGKIISTIDEKTETWKTKRTMGEWTWTYLLFIFILLFYFIYQIVISVGLNNEIFVTLMIFLVGALVINGLLEFVLPRTMTTSENRTFDDSFNKVEHFKEKFKEIINESSFKTISVVIDNLDRVEPSDALEMIRMLKSFVGEEILGGHKFVLIIPCDEQELAKHINKELYVDDAHEFLRKFFNVSLLVPELIHEDIVAFTKNELDSVVDSLYPSISDEDVSIVSFIISRASRRSPRQVKILINSFIGFWQGAGLANTAGQNRGISPLGAAIYICLSYLSKGKQLPSNFSEVFNQFAKEGDDALNEFLQRIQSFRQNISELEWLYLKKLQVSDHERAVPNFVDIYFAITDLEWDSLNDLISDEQKLADLIHRLDLKVREGDGVTKARFVRWTLSLIANKKVFVADFPRQLRIDIRHLLSRQPTEWSNTWMSEWLSLIDEGLAEYAIQDSVSQIQIINLLNWLKGKIEKEKPTELELRFITRLIIFTRHKFWINTPHYDALTGALDGVVYHCASQKNEKFIQTVLNNIHIVYFEGTGVKLADELVNLYQNEKFEGFVLDDIFSYIQQGNRGAYTFAAQWLQRVNLTHKIKQGQVQLTFQSINVLNKLDDPLVFKPILLSNNQFIQLISDLESICAKQNKQGKTNDIVPAICALSSIIPLAKKIGFSQQATQAVNSLRDQIWPSLVGSYKKFSEGDKTSLLKYLDEHGRECPKEWAKIVP